MPHPHYNPFSFQAVQRVMNAASPGPPGHTDIPQEAVGPLQEAGRALGLGQPDVAERALQRVLERFPGLAEAHRLLGIAALMRGERPAAVAHLRKVLAQRPADAVIHMNLGSALVESGETGAGLAHLERACELASGNAEYWCNLGVGYQFAEKLEPARDAFARAVALEPGHIRSRIKLAYALIILGETAAAVSTLRGTLRLQPDCVQAWEALGNLKTERLGLEDVRQLRQLLARAGMPDEMRISLAFTLAKALEDQSDYDAAYDVVAQANALQRRHVYWSRDEERARVDAIAQAFSEDMPDPVDSELGKEVIFVVHLPRSGSTLTEQILAAHPQVRGGDELLVLPDILDQESARRGKPFPQWVPEASREDWRRLGEDYLSRTRQVRGEHARLTDKTPNNWAFVGAALAMLPGARVVNARRDPLETCFSCFRQRFQVGCVFTYDLDDMVDYYAGYQRLSALWRQAYPQRYFENDYERLQEDTEGQIRRLLEFCELPFDPACLDFHRARRTVSTFSSAQVRQPLQRDTARSARYGARLDPLREKLRAAGIPLSGHP